EDRFGLLVRTVLSEPQCDDVFIGNIVPSGEGDICFAVEYLPGQYNQRADSAQQCAELVTGIKPVIRSALVYVLQPGKMPVSDAALEAVKKYMINPVDSGEASMDLPLSLDEEETYPEDVPVLQGFIGAGVKELEAIGRSYGLAMNLDDLRFCRDWFLSIGRDPTLAEIRVLDTYWSDHCRHTTFNTILEKIDVAEGPHSNALKNALALYRSVRDEIYTEDEKKRHPCSLMDMAVIGAKTLRRRGLASDVDVSEEINACTVKVNAEFKTPGNGVNIREPWLLLFKNETHNHPTEIEPFGGAATCLGGAIRDPLSGRAFVYQAMRITGGADPGTSLDKTLPGKLPQIKIAREAAAGYSSYGNQIGLATGQVAEFYHEGFLAKRMELGAVIAAVPSGWVRREEPQPGDLVILVGGRTGRDGIGGATGSSKVHSGESVQSAGAEVQKGNAVEERKLQRLFRNPSVTKLIKRCNDFGAGGVSVAVGELAAGLDIDLDKVPKKYAGLNGIELAISESQERMAVVCSAADASAFIDYAAAENLEAIVIAAVTSGDVSDYEASLKMKWRGKTIVDLSRKFLNSNGAPRSAQVMLSPASINLAPAALLTTAIPALHRKSSAADGFLQNLKQELMSLRSCSRRGLQERFDGSIGASSVLFPWGGKEQGTPECGMAALLPSLDKKSLTASLMSFGYDPVLMKKNPYEGAKGSIREALAKYTCLGGDYRKSFLSLQEYFERPVDCESWGRPAAALLGALEAQLALGVPAIGGKDSMSGNYLDTANGIAISVPPTLVAFAAGTVPASSVHSGALSGDAENVIILLAQITNDSGKNEWDIFKANMDTFSALSGLGCIRSAYPVGSGGAAAGLALMAFGNNTGLEANLSAFSDEPGFSCQGSILAEIDGTAYRQNPQIGAILAKAGFMKTAAVTLNEPVFRITEGTEGKQNTAEIPLAELRQAYESALAKVYPQTSSNADYDSSLFIPHSSLLINNSSFLISHSSSPLVVLPVFPGTNCEWDMERAFREAGARTKQVIFRNRSREDIIESGKELAAAINEAQILALSGGFSAGDEPDGSGKFIANVLGSAAVSDAVNSLLEKRGGLILGICNGFQALIKLGLVPYGKFYDPSKGADPSMPTLTFNRIGRHVSRMVRTRVMECISPWLAMDKPGTIHILPVSHGEGRLV
ncbi:MAG: phosphoribosylformylglycinamidine synthase, partial [Treponema sp.]|nr:phosphoribosylformylglycinamidine synthase [Treponema sp.]